MTIKTIAGTILILIGVALIAFAAFITIALASAFGITDITTLFTTELLIFLAPFAIMSLICILPGYYLLKSGIIYQREQTSNAKLWAQAGIVNKNQGNYKEALENFDRALNTGTLMYNQKIAVLLEKAEVCQSIGNAEDAIQCCKKVLKLDPSNKKAKQLLNEFVV